MKLRKILAAIAAAAVAVTSIAVSAAAYSIEKDLEVYWDGGSAPMIPAEEFEGATTDSVFKFTITCDDLASFGKTAEKDIYYCIKPMINDSGWPFINDLTTKWPVDGGAYQFGKVGDITEFKFKVSNEEELEHLQIAGMALLGYGITLHEFSWSDDDTLDLDVAPAAGDTDAATDSSKGSPDTGIEDVAVVAGLAVIAGGSALMFSRKRK